jgi:hypothetical protein
MTKRQINDKTKFIEGGEPCTNLSRRHAMQGVLGASALAVWHKPVVNTVITPAHAQTTTCADVVIGNVTFGPVSGTNTPPVCQVTFDVLSSIAGQPINIISITDSNTDADTTITYDAFGEATDTAGPRVVWRGPASDAPFCSDLMPITDVIFIVTFTCEAVGGTELTYMFMLSEILV